MSSQATKIAAAVGVGALGIAAYLLGKSNKKPSGGQVKSLAHEQFNPDQDYPDLTKHNNVMASYLTPQLYGSLREKTTPRGWTLDNCIQTGVDNPGHPFIKTVGIVAGDEESYEVSIAVAVSLSALIGRCV